MMRSLFSGVSGLRIHQTKMDVIGNNISNVNTVGFKSSRVTFQEVFSQTISNATAANPEVNRGGVNPTQIGLGAALGAIDIQMTEGAAERTDNPLDIKINGAGFFIVNDGLSNMFTKAGNFRVDAMGNLVTSSGMKVMGWQADDDPNNPGQQVITPTQVSPITVTTAENMYIGPRTTTAIEFAGNISIEDGKAGINKSISFYDSLGNKYDLACTLKLVSATEEGSDSDEGNSWVLTSASSMKMNNIKDIELAEPVTVNLVFDKTGKLASVSGGSEVEADDDLDDEEGGSAIKSFALQMAADINVLPADAVFGKYSMSEDGELTSGPIIIDVSSLTQYTGNTSASFKPLDGNQAGKLSGFSIGSDGVVTGRYTNGQTKILGQLAVAEFDNPAGLEKLGDNLFTTTNNSGAFDGQGLHPQVSGGSLSSGVLEMSNVDLAAEFTQMITTQRGFQANSRIISTSDEILQELVNLKR